DGDRLRHERELEDGIAVENAGVIEINVGRMVRARAGRKDERFTLVPIASAHAVLDLDRFRADKAGASVQELHEISFVEPAAHLYLIADDAFRAAEQLRKGELSR